MQKKSADMTYRSIRVCALSAGLILFGSLSVHFSKAAQDTQAQPPSTKPSEGKVKAPIYMAPDPYGPKVRVDGNVRGTEDASLTLTVLAPQQVGFVTSEQPCL